jgi:hypothetical protein
MASRFSVRATVLGASMVLVSLGVVLTDPGCYSGGPLGETKGVGGGGEGGGGVGPDGQVLTDAGVDAPHYFDGSTVQQCPLAFAVDTPYTYVAKVKNLLVGLPPTQAEVDAVAGVGADAGAVAFAGLVNTWMTSTTEPALVTGGYAQLYTNKMMRFFELAFQQTQIATVDFENMLNAGQLTFDSNKQTVGLMLQNNQEVFARTMLQLDQMGQPFNTATTTTKYMLTPAMKAFYALLDDWQLNDNLQGVSDSVGKAGLMPTVTVTKAGTNDPANGEFVDPNMTFSTGCTTLTYSPSGQKFISNTLWRMLVGEYEPDDNGCTATTTGIGQFVASDFTDWQLVTLSQPTTPGTAPPFPFWVMANLRRGGSNYTSITLNRPYVGFFTTPAFFANWQTNASNQDRVTTNQSIIVATQQMYFQDPTIPTYNPKSYSLDNDHMGDSGTSPCFGCHQILDPTRQVFARNLSWYYGAGLEQADTGAGPAYFASWGVQQPMKTLTDFGTILSTHPLFASAWPQKLCYYVNSGACDLTDPAFLSIQSIFQANKTFSWSQLVQAIMTSPITTHTVETQSVIGTAAGPGNCQPITVSRRDHLCSALNARLGFEDVCGINPSVKPVLSNAALNIVPGLPSDGYGRGSIVPVLPNEPSLFYRTGTENFCAFLAQLVVDNANPPADAGATTFSSTGCMASSTSCAPIGSGCTDVDAGAGMTCSTPGPFVTLVAGLPSSDPRAPLLAGALMAHFNEAMASKLDGGKKVTATDALQSAFVVACIAPSAVSIGL